MSYTDEDVAKDVGAMRIASDAQSRLIAWLAVTQLENRASLARIQKMYDEHKTIEERLTKLEEDILHT